MAGIETYRALEDPALGFRFQVSIPDPPVALGVLEFSLRGRSANLPGRTLERAESTLGGYRRPHAGREEYPPWTTTIEEGLNMRMYLGLVAWSDFANNSETGVMAPKLVYGRTGLMNVLGLDRQSPTLTRRMIGLYPEVVGDIQFDSASSEIVTCDVTWVMDYALNV